MSSTPDRQSMEGGLRSPAVRAGLSVGLATGAYGISFGALSVAQGLTIAQTCALSLLMFTGGSQFAFVGVIGSGGGGVAAFATAALLGFRNALYSLQVVPILAMTRWWQRPASAHLTIDESAAVSFAQPEPVEQRRGFWATGLGVFFFWNLFTLLGAWLGDIMDDPRRYGLDGAAAAAFIALLWPRLSSALARWTAVGAMVVAGLVLPLAGTGLAVLAAAAFAAGAALVSGGAESADPEPAR